jgi:hypothetical protein
MKKLLIATCVLLAVLAAAKEAGRKPAEVIPESWLEEKMLEQVGDFQLIPKEFGSKISYKMDESSYEVLKPIGIACQMMKDSRGREIDVVIIAGRSMEAFHDQEICFNAQGWTIEKMVERDISTKSRGDVPVSVMTISRDGGASRSAFYMFRTPEGHSSYDKAKWDYLVGKFRNPFKDQLGFSYRFIGLTPDITEKEVEEFAVAYLDQLDQTTNGKM